MTDLEDLLRQDAAAFRAAAPPPPDLAAAVDLATRERPRRRASRRTWVATGLAAAAAVVAVVVALTLVAAHPDADRTPAAPTPAPSITVDGASVPYLGPAPWNGAIADPADPRVVTIDADLDSVPGVCGLPEARTSVAEGPDRVTILVAGYEKPLPPGLDCAGVGHAPLRVRITLAAPLGSRTLVDAADGATHAVLDPAAFPTLTPPAGYVDAPLSWDDRTPDQFVRDWTPPAHGPTSAITLFVTPAANVDDHGTPDGPIVRTDVPVGSSAATIWHVVDTYNDETMMRWPLDGGRTASLLVIGRPGQPVLSQDQIIALARTVVAP